MNAPPSPSALDENNQVHPPTLSWQDKINAYERLMRLDKPIGIFLLLWPTLIALWIASYRKPFAFVAFLFLMGTVIMRSVGCIINDVWDKKFDGKVWRTQDRPLVVGLVSVTEAMFLCVSLLLAALAILLKLDEPRANIIAGLGVVITILYPLGKRFLVAPQAVLGIAFSLGIPMAFTALHNQFPPVMWWLFVLNFFYVMAYDTSYAMADREDDQKLGLKSTAIWFGRADVAMVLSCHLLYAVGMTVLLFKMGWLYGPSLAFVALMIIIFLWDQFVLLRHRIPENCFSAFRRSHILALIFWVALWQWPFLLSLPW